MGDTNGIQNNSNECNEISFVRTLESEYPVFTGVMERWSNALFVFLPVLQNSNTPGHAFGMTSLSRCAQWISSP